MVTMSDEIDQKRKVDQNTWFFLRFFPPAHFGHWKLKQAAYAPGDHGDHGTSVSDEIDQKMKVDQNTWFFLRFFPPAHFDHWKLRQAACAPGDHGDHGTSESNEDGKLDLNLLVMSVS